jgi:hypothetical protein
MTTPSSLPQPIRSGRAPSAEPPAVRYFDVAEVAQVLLYLSEDSCVLVS